MTKLEEEIFIRIISVPADSPILGEYEQNVAKAAAEVAKKYIEKAYEEGVITGEVAFEDKRSESWIKDEKDLWLKENGIIE